MVEQIWLKELLRQWPTLFLSAKLIFSPMMFFDAFVSFSEDTAVHMARHVSAAVRLDTEGKLSCKKSRTSPGAGCHAQIEREAQKAILNAFQTSDTHCGALKLR